LAVTASGGIPQFAVRSRPKAGQIQSASRRTKFKNFKNPVLNLKHLDFDIV